LSKTTITLLSEKPLYETPTIKNKQKASAKAAGLNQLIEDFGGSTIHINNKIIICGALFRRESIYPGRFSRLIGGFIAF